MLDVVRLATEEVVIFSEGAIFIRRPCINWQLGLCLLLVPSASPLGMGGNAELVAGNARSLEARLVGRKASIFVKRVEASPVVSIGAQ